MNNISNSNYNGLDTNNISIYPDTKKLIDNDPNTETLETSTWKYVGSTKLNKNGEKVPDGKWYKSFNDLQTWKRYEELGEYTDWSLSYGKIVEEDDNSKLEMEWAYGSEVWENFFNMDFGEVSRIDKKDTFSSDKLYFSSGFLEKVEKLNPLNPAEKIIQEWVFEENNGKYTLLHWTEKIVDWKNIVSEKTFWNCYTDKNWTKVIWRIDDWEARVFYTNWISLIWHFKNWVLVKGIYDDKNYFRQWTFGEKFNLINWRVESHSKLKTSFYKDWKLYLRKELKIKEWYFIKESWEFSWDFWNEILTQWKQEKISLADKKVLEVKDIKPGEQLVNYIEKNISEHVKNIFNSSIRAHNVADIMLEFYSEIAKDSDWMSNELYANLSISDQLKTKIQHIQKVLSQYQESSDIISSMKDYLPIIKNAHQEIIFLYSRIQFDDFKWPIKYFISELDKFISFWNTILWSQIK